MVRKFSVASVKSLDAQLAAQIRSATSVASLSQGVVEVVANSLDAGARNIIVTLDVHKRSFTVEDDGHGVSFASYEQLGLRNSTSKLADIGDYDTGVTSLGYRGEALASLAALAEELQVTSRATGSFETFSKVFNNGRLVSFSPSRIQRLENGTTVTVRRLRIQSDRPNKRQRSQALLEEIAGCVFKLVLPHCGCSIRVKDVDTGRLVLNLLKGRILSEIGAQLVTPQADEVPAWVSIDPTTQELGCLDLPPASMKGLYNLSGILSNDASPYRYRDTQLFYCNNRLSSAPEVSGLISSWFLATHTAPGKHKRPAYLLLLSCPSAHVDVNSEPDKSVAIFRHSSVVRAMLTRMLTQAWGLPPASAEFSELTKTANQQAGCKQTGRKPLGAEAARPEAYDLSGNYSIAHALPAVRTQPSYALWPEGTQAPGQSCHKPEYKSDENAERNQNAELDIGWAAVCSRQRGWHLQSRTRSLKTVYPGATQETPSLLQTAKSCKQQEANKDGGVLSDLNPGDCEEGDLNNQATDFMRSGKIDGTCLGLGPPVESHGTVAMDPDVAAYSCLHHVPDHNPDDVLHQMDADGAEYSCRYPSHCRDGFGKSLASTECEMEATLSPSAREPEFEYAIWSADSDLEQTSQRESDEWTAAAVDPCHRAPWNLASPGIQKDAIMEESNGHEGARLSWSQPASQTVADWLTECHMGQKGSVKSSGLDYEADSDSHPGCLCGMDSRACICCAEDFSEIPAMWPSQHKVLKGISTSESVTPTRSVDVCGREIELTERQQGSRMRKIQLADLELSPSGHHLHLRPDQNDDWHCQTTCMLDGEPESSTFLPSVNISVNIIGADSIPYRRHDGMCGMRPKHLYKISSRADTAACNLSPSSHNKMMDVKQPLIHGVLDLLLEDDNVPRRVRSFEVPHSECRAHQSGSLGVQGGHADQDMSILGWEEGALPMGSMQVGVGDCFDSVCNQRFDVAGVDKHAPQVQKGLMWPLHSSLCKDGVGMRAEQELPREGAAMTPMRKPQDQPIRQAYQESLPCVTQGGKDVPTGRTKLSLDDRVALECMPLHPVRRPRMRRVAGISLRQTDHGAKWSWPAEPQKQLKAQDGEQSAGRAEYTAYQAQRGVMEEKRFRAVEMQQKLKDDCTGQERCMPGSSAAIRFHGLGKRAEQHQYTGQGTVQVEDQERYEKGQKLVSEQKKEKEPKCLKVLSKELPALEQQPDTESAHLTHQVSSVSNISYIKPVQPGPVAYVLPSKARLISKDHISLPSTDSVAMAPTTDVPQEKHCLYSTHGDSPRECKTTDVPINNNQGESSKERSASLLGGQSLVDPERQSSPSLPTSCRLQAPKTLPKSGPNSGSLKALAVAPETEPSMAVSAATGTVILEEADHELWESTKAPDAADHRNAPLLTATNPSISAVSTPINMQARSAAVLASKPQQVGIVTIESLTSNSRQSRVKMDIGYGQLAPRGVMSTSGPLQREMLSTAHVIGQVDKKFVIIRCGSVLLAVDQHAADERIRLEALTDAVLHALRQASCKSSESLSLTAPDGSHRTADQVQMEEDDSSGRATYMKLVAGAGRRPAATKSLISVCPLMQPEQLWLPPHEAVKWMQREDCARAWGWRATCVRTDCSVEQPGTDQAFASTSCAASLSNIMAGSRLQLSHVPCILGVALTSTDLKEYLDQSDHNGSGELPTAVLRVLKSKACRTAIMFGDALSMEECEDLIKKLARTKLWSICAHGRPTVAPLCSLTSILLSRTDLKEKQEIAKAVVDGVNPNL